MRKMYYRPDIDGLRALAVLSVVIFHLNKNWLPSGFLGVDVFFVISGFLITSIIYREMSLGDFSFARFYVRRIKRILPVFFVVLIVGMLLAWWLFLYDDAVGVANSAFASTFFLANIYFSRGGGYFDISQEEKPFLHIWSLSVEEQFYFVFPVFLLLLFKWKWSRENKIKILLGVVVLLLLTSLLDLKKLGISFNIYYLPHLRMVEMLVGSILAIFMAKSEKVLDKTKSSVLGVFSFGILILCFCFDIFTPPIFPGVLALVPCVSAAVMIWVNENSVTKPIFSNKVSVWIGKISYSLYLWHWVVLAFIRYIYGTGELSKINLAIAVVLMFGLSALSYYFVEQPVRHRDYTFLRSFSYFYVAPAVVVLGLFFGVKYIKTNYVEQRFKFPEDICHNRFDCDCSKGNKSKSKKILVIGDSHAGCLNPFIDIIGKKEGWRADVVSCDSCSFTLFGYITPWAVKDIFKNRNKFLFDNYNKYDVVIISVFNYLYQEDEGTYLDEYIKSIKKLINDGKVVYIMNESLNFDLRPIRYYSLKFLDRNNLYGKKYKENLEFNEKVMKRIKKETDAVIVDIRKYYKYPFSEEGLPLFGDDDHLNKYGAEYVARKFIEDGRVLIRPEDLK